MDKWDQLGEAYDFPAFSGRPRCYLIATTPRCGSHYLGHLLHNTGQLGSPLEYFSLGRIHDWSQKLDTPYSPALFQNIMRRRTSPSGWFGVKAHWPHFARILAQADLMEIFQLQTYIHLQRQDRIAQAVSLVIAQQTSSWISFQTPQKSPVYDPTAIAAAWHAIYAEEQQWNTFFEQQGVQPLKLIYEELVQNPCNAISRALEHCDVKYPANPLTSSIQPERQATALNAEWIDRFRQESAAFLPSASE